MKIEKLNLKICKQLNKLEVKLSNEMAVRIKIKTWEDSKTHFDFSEGGQNYTICGLETGGDESLGIQEPIVVKRKVNCARCIQIVKFCQKIKVSEFEGS